ncbi:MAG: ABC transporter permease [Bdellovibrionaceae bacterium]|nr:ABC transporter permease [Pseudobdellovibrionaceae bacterium]
MRLSLWLAWRFLSPAKTLLVGTNFLAFLGLVLGIASLVVAMAVVSGYETTLRNAVIDVAGEVEVLQVGRNASEQKQLEDRIRALDARLRGIVPFARIEAVAARQGRVRGVLLQGMDAQSWDEVLNLDKRLVEGRLDLKPQDGEPVAWLGKGLASELGLSVGDMLSVVIPVADGSESAKLTRSLARFRVQAILDLGKHDWNTRFVMTDLSSFQRFSRIGSRFSGFLLSYGDPDLALGISSRLEAELGFSHYVSNWFELNENLFRAVEFEKFILFMVISIILMVSAFNISSTLFVGVLQRYSDIAILKAVGMTKSKLVFIFSLQGLILGFLGYVGGGLVGWGLTQGFMWAQDHFGLLDKDVYRLDRIVVDLRFLDLLWIALFTLFVCTLATLAPALRGARMKMVEGLRYG